MTDQQIAPDDEEHIEQSIDAGFIGTLAGFIDWIEDHLQYGSMQISRPFVRSTFGQDNPSADDNNAASDADEPNYLITLRMSTGGYSLDEYLLSRVRGSVFSIYWQSSHSGGLHIYQYPCTAEGEPLPLNGPDTQAIQWLPAAPTGSRAAQTASSKIIPVPSTAHLSFLVNHWEYVTSGVADVDGISATHATDPDRETSHEFTVYVLPDERYVLGINHTAVGLVSDTDWKSLDDIRNYLAQEFSTVIFAD